MYARLDLASVQSRERQRDTETADLNITCNQQMTTQKREEAETEGL